MYMDSFCPNGGCHVELLFQSRYILNTHINYNKCLLRCLIDYLHPAQENLNRVKNYNKSE